ncbi:MAG: hypothetical protein IJM85_04340 [Clostridia bacterium]|nr:hypothetical protein [Clostridia bacterium]
MAERKTRILQKQIKAAGDELFALETDIGTLLAQPIEPGDGAASFRCRLLLNRIEALDERLTELRVELPVERGTVVSHGLITQQKQMLAIQKNTVTALLDCIKQSSSVLLEARKASLAAEAKALSIKLGKGTKRSASRKRKQAGDELPRLES